jgi:outer membrane protein assembly factor BamB
VRRCVVLLAVLAACGKRTATEATNVGLGSGMICNPVDGFASSVPVAEASGAAWWDMGGGKTALVINSDSGNDGAYAIIDPETGASLETGKFPLGNADANGHRGDDTEGLASRGDRLYGLTSSGWMRVWKRAGTGFELVDGPYPIAPEATGFSSPLTDSNAGKNYEGLAIAPAPVAGCVGVACAKDDGHIYCLTEQDGKLQVDPTRGVEIEKKGAMADCAFAPDGSLYTANNMFGMSEVARIDDWAVPARAKVTVIGQMGVGFPEGIAVRGDDVYRLSDTGGSPSMMAKFRCRAPGR